MKISQTLVRSSMVLLALTGSLASAATVSVTRSAKLADNTQWNISGYGTLDWGVWKKGGGATTGVATDSKLGASLISDLVLSGGGGFLASTNSQTTWDFTFTDGTAGAGSLSDANGVFNSTLASNTVGIGFTVTLPTTGTYQISVWAAGFSLANGQLTASLPGASQSSNGLADDTSGSKDMYLYTILASATTAGDVLTVNLVNTDATPAGNSHVLISAVAVQLIPEPSVALLGASAIGLSLVRRRRSF